MHETPAGRWRKRVAEAVVIILSILAAFAIDAWWDRVQEQKRARGEVAALRSEFDAIDRELTRAAAELQAASDATLRLARLAGPQRTVVSPDSFGHWLTIALTVNAVELPTGALGNLLSSGDLPLLGDLALQTNLASWPSIANLMSVKFAYLVANRDESVLPEVNRLTALSPLLSAAFPRAWSDDNTFPFDIGALLSSRGFENLMAERWIGIQIAALTVADAQRLAKTVRTGLLHWR